METTTLKLYIGTKMVKAEPMAKSAAVAKGWARPLERNEDVPGYHVQYTNPDGSTYDSWSPKDVFEQSYQIVENFKDRLFTAKLRLSMLIAEAEIMLNSGFKFLSASHVLQELRTIKQELEQWIYT